MNRVVENSVILAVGVVLFGIGVALALKARESFESAVLMAVMLLLLFGSRVPRAIRRSKTLTPTPDGMGTSLVLNLMGVLAIILLIITLVTSGNLP